MKQYYEINENITVVVAQCRQGQGWESFTIYSDPEDRFISYHKIHATRAEAEDRAIVLIAKFSK
jgi:hypothetical protein